MKITHTFLVLVVLLIAACQSVEQTPTPTVTPTNDVQVVAQSAFTPIPTANLQPSPTRTLPPSPTYTPTITLTPTLTPSPTYTPTLTLTPTYTFTPSITPTLAPEDHYLLSRPIERLPDRVDWVDRTYPYGGTQFATREVHLGVEFVNPRFTPILAAADGTVFFAGEDSEIEVGPKTNYYGRVVIIEHEFVSPEGLPVYTLYGHMERIDVEVGQHVTAGDKLGGIGDSGIAIGPHLHFEVRLGDPLDYLSTRNPELWLRPYPEFGTLTGTVTGPDNAPVYGIVLRVRNETLNRETYTYGSERVNSDIAWRENFTLGDLPEGEYEIIISDKNGRIRFSEVIGIANRQTTRILIHLDDLSSIKTYGDEDE